MSIKIYEDVISYDGLGDDLDELHSLIEELEEVRRSAVHTIYS